MKKESVKGLLNVDQLSMWCCSYFILGPADKWPALFDFFNWTQIIQEMQVYEQTYDSFWDSAPSWYGHNAEKNDWHWIDADWPVCVQGAKMEQ